MSETELKASLGNLFFDNLDLVPQALGIVDMKGRVVFINDTFEKQYNLSLEAIKGEKITELHCSSSGLKIALKKMLNKILDDQYVNRHIVIHVDSRKSEINWDHLKEDEESIGIIFTVVKDSAGVSNRNNPEMQMRGPVEASGIKDKNKDIEKLIESRRRLEKQYEMTDDLNKRLMKSNFELGYTKKLLELVLKNAKVGIWKYNFKTRVSKYDETCTNIFGYDPSYPGATIRWKERVVDEYKGYITRSVMDYTHGKIPEYDIQYKFRRLDDQIIWIQEKGEIVETDENGDAVLLLGSVRDITPQKRFEQLLIKAKEDAEKASRLKSDLISNVNHELRTPLTIIMGMTETLLTSETDSEKKSFLQQIFESSSKLLKMINDVLDLSKIESGNYELDKKTISIRPVLNKCFSGFRNQADKKGLEPRLYIDKNVPEKIKTDNDKLFQIMNNLFGNALKYTEKGLIGLHVSKKEDELLFSIFDTGIGIPKKHIKRIFQRFYQVDTSTRRKYNGTGLGLSIVQDLVELLGGRISVSSVPDKGSCFSFTIPLG